LGSSRTGVKVVAESDAAGLKAPCPRATEVAHNDSGRTEDLIIFLVIGCSD
jgi:hypothetical protein